MVEADRLDEILVGTRISASLSGVKAVKRCGFVAWQVCLVNPG